MESFALFSLPHSVEFNFINGKAFFFQNMEQVSYEINQSGTGFLVHPFHVSSKNEICFIKGKIEKWQSENELDFDFDNQKSTTTKASEFINLTKKAIEEIKTGNALKIVTSRTTSVKIETDLISIFKQLKSTFDNCFVCLFSNPTYGTWISASPEVLLNFERKSNSSDCNFNGQIFSMAGTKNLKEKFTSKEIDEQKIVTDYILKAIRKSHSKNNIISQEKEIVFGGIKHLLTEINIQSDTSLLPLAFDLHPTPAVGGMEKQAATEFILSNENFERNLYTGFWGPLFSPEKFSLYVNLRTMKICNQSEGIMYAGAGITAQSNPENEWFETERKTETFVSAFKK